jgi:hypothetical protein
MALRRLRRSCRVLGLLLLASFWGLPHGAGDDLCAPNPLEAHDESKHVMGAPDGADPHHCAVCHSIRTSRRPFTCVAHLRSPLTRGALIHASEAIARRAPALDKLPARAPPSR